MDKLESFKIRNRKRNSHLYLDGLMENIDYIVCPVSGERLSMIRNDYISKILNLDPHEYWQKYPNIPRSSISRQKNIKTGLQAIDPLTGITKHQLSIQKSQVTKNTQDASGKTIYQKVGEKTRASHMANIDKLGRNGYSQAATKNIIKGNHTKAAKGLILLPEERNLYYRYKTVILYLTTKNKSFLLNETDCKIGKAGQPGAHHIDHIYSIYHSWKNKVSPLVVGSLQNLQILPWEENISKWTRSSITLEQLLMKCGISYMENTKQYDAIMNIILEDSQNGNQPTGAFVLERYYATNIC